MLRFEQLYKSYGRRNILDGVSHQFDRGVYALQGPNGIGKSTLLKLLAGASAADSGQIWIEDDSLIDSSESARRQLSYVPDESPIYPFMTGRAFLEFVALAKKETVGPNIRDLAHKLGLDVHFDTRFSVMSLGTQKKFMLCAAWIGEPKVLLFDEPSNALDLSARAELAGIFVKAATDSTLLFTSHDADFVNATSAVVITMEEILSSSLEQEV